MRRSPSPRMERDQSAVKRCRRPAASGAAATMQSAERVCPGNVFAHSGAGTTRSASQAIVALPAGAASACAFLSEPAAAISGPTQDIRSSASVGSTKPMLPAVAHYPRLTMRRELQGWLVRTVLVAAACVSLAATAPGKPAGPAPLSKYERDRAKMMLKVV